MFKFTKSLLTLACLSLLMSNLHCQLPPVPSTEDIVDPSTQVGPEVAADLADATTVPADIANPAGNTAVPADDAIVPADVQAADPVDAGATIVPADIADPASNTAVPADDAVVPADAEAADPDTTVVPADVANPANNTAVPADDVIVPADIEAAGPADADTTVVPAGVAGAAIPVSAAAATIAAAANTTADTPTTAPTQNYPPHTLSLYITEPYFYSNDVNNQVIAHLFCNINAPTGVIQCTVYDGRDPTTARLLGIEYVINETTFNRTPPEEQRFWHSHAYGVQSGNIIAPDLTGDNYTSTLETIAGTYGKTVYLWSQTQELPVGDPILAFAFSGDGQLNSTTSAFYDEQVNVAASQRVLENSNISIPVPAVNSDSWDFTGVVPVFNNVNVTLPPNLWGLAFALEQQ